MFQVMATIRNLEIPGRPWGRSISRLSKIRGRAMSKIFNSKGILACLCVLLVGTSGSAAWAYDLPGIPPSGAPAFRNAVKVDLNTNSGRLRITGRKDFLFADPAQGIMLGTNANYTLTANFNKNTGAFQDGSLSLKGAIADLGIANGTQLVTADITAWNLQGTQSGLPLPGGGFDLWGFRTENIVCSPLLLIACTPTESVYVELDDAFSGSFANKFKTTGFAITTVPVPAAAWLFGSGLGLLGWMARRRRVSTNQVAA